MTDSKIEALSVQTNIHIALRLLREGHIQYHDRYKAYVDDCGRIIGSYNDSYLGRTVDARAWHHDLQRRFPLHPAVDKLLGTYRPKDWQQLVLEYPHQAESDRNRLAYTQNEDKGKRNLQTVTTLGKYLTRHFPQLPDHEIRNAVASYSVGGCKILSTTAEMLQALMNGPSSCMSNNWRNRNLDDHPYNVYDPSLGWGMAVRIEDGEIIGRALVYECGEDKRFVRTYLRPSNGGYSQADDSLNAWLRDQGYEHASDWEGCVMRYIDGRGNRPLAPYLDGGLKDVEVIHRDGVKLLRVAEEGEYRFEFQDGSCSENEDGEDCADCGANVDDGDGYWVNADESSYVCRDCCDNNYYYAYSRRGFQRYIYENNVVHIGDEVYDEDYLSDNNIVCLHNGEHVHNDNAVYIESAEEYYECDDEDICYDDYNNQYELRDNCVDLADGSICHRDDAWRCEHTKEWYNNDEEYVEVDDVRYHPDHAPEPETDDETTEVSTETSTETTGE
jgi:hypothetical protein